MSSTPPLTVLLLGATGALGRRAAGELVRAREVGRVLAGGRDHAELHDLVAAFGGAEGKVEAAEITRDRAELFASADVVVSCAGPPGEAETRFVEAALEANVPYVSLCDDAGSTRDALRLGETARPNGPTVVVGCGLRPGLTNLLFRLAADGMDSVEAGSISVAQSISSDTGPASELHDLQILASDNAVLSEGRLEISPGGSSPQLVYFPDPVGWVETFRCAHPEVFTLPNSNPGLKDLQWRFGLSEKPAMDVLRASVAVGFGRSSASRRSWLRLSGALRPMFERFSSTGSWSAARVDVWGTKDGRTSEVSMAVVDHLANLATVPLVWAAVGLGAGAIRKPGVWAAEDVIDPRALVKYLSRRGIRVAKLEPATI